MHNAEHPGISPDDGALARALARWENEGGRPASDWEPRVVSVRRAEQRPQSSGSRLIKGKPLDRGAVCSAFEALATKIQRSDGCDRVTALQRAVDENPEQFAEYCRAMR